MEMLSNTLPRSHHVSASRHVLRAFGSYPSDDDESSSPQLSEYSRVTREIKEANLKGGILSRDNIARFAWVLDPDQFRRFLHPREDGSMDVSKAQAVLPAILYLLQIR